MKLKHILITSALCLGLTSCFSDKNVKREVVGGLSGAFIIGGLAKAANSSDAGVAIGMIVGYMVGTAIYDKMTKKDKTTLSKIINYDISNPSDFTEVGFWENPETNKIYKYKRIAKNNNCSTFEINVKDKNIDWVLKEQHRACLNNTGYISLT